MGKNGRTLIYTCADSVYAHWIPLYCLGMLYHNDNIDIEIGIEGELGKNECDAVEFLKNRYPHSKIVIHENFFDRYDDMYALVDDIKMLHNTVRFVTTPTIVDEYVYIGDIDIICLEYDIFSSHISFIENEQMCYSNLVRKSTPPRLTGLHFSKYDSYYPLPSLEGINMMKLDEEILTDLVIRKGVVLNENSGFRPVHGIHFSSNRPSVGGNDGLPGWGAEPYKKQWMEFTNSEEYKYIIGKTVDWIKLMTRKVDIYFENNFEDYYELIKNSEMFNWDWFINEYSIPENSDPVIYFYENWKKLRLNSSPKFNTINYLKVNNDVEKNGMNPLIHYIKYGKKENRLLEEYTHDPKYENQYRILINSSLFNEEWFVNEYSIPENIDPVIYFLENCINLNLNPSKDFDSGWYLDEYPDVKKSGMNPLVHYIKYGKNEGRLPKLYEFAEVDDLNLNKSIRGKFGHFFLINDSNMELRQHFDDDYENKFDTNSFIRDYNFKKEIFNSHKMDYFYFIVPDKSIVCKNLIPFKYTNIKRNVDNLRFIPDFSIQLDQSCYWTKDSHYNCKGAKKIAYNILNYIDNSFTLMDFEEMIKKCDVKKNREPWDLVSEVNWSYSSNEKRDILENCIDFSYHVPKDLQHLSIPDEFLYSNSRRSVYIYNQNSFSKSRCLLFGDSTSIYLKYFLSMYFREVFIYWDHLNLNKNLIKWFSPDIIFEIRIERFLDNYFTPVWLKECMDLLKLNGD